MRTGYKRAPYVIAQPQIPDPPRYLFIDGHPYMLASHAAEQMERACKLYAAHVLATVAPSITVEIKEPA